MKYTKIIAIILLSLNLGSCNFLETVPQEFVSPENFFNTEEEAFMSLTYVYKCLSREQAYANVYPLLIAGTDDLSFYDRSAATAALQFNNFGTSDSQVYDFWDALYEAINNANFFLENVVKVPDSEISETSRGNYIGEAKFLRAYCYFLLAQCYGDVPYKTESQKSATDVKIANTPMNAVLENIVREMEEAEPLVAEIGTVQSGRITKSAVRGILSRVYLKMAGWPTNGGKPMYEKANYWAKQVNINNKHRLNPDYSDIFIKLAADGIDNVYRESIWEMEYKRDATRQGTGRIGSSMGINNGDVSADTQGYSYGFVSATLILWDLFNDVDGDGTIDSGFEQGSVGEREHPDVRRDWSIAPYRFAKNAQGKYVKNYLGYKGMPGVDVNGKPTGKPVAATSYVERNAGKYRREYETTTPRDKNGSPVNFPVLRYSDVLLMIAESENEVNNGPTKAAYDAINEVRRRAMPTVALIVDKDYASFKQLVKDERARELCFEAIRKFDLIRWDDFLSAMKQVVANTTDSRWTSNKRFAAVSAGNVSERYKWLPIPNKELGLNSLLKQNPLW